MIMHSISKIFKRNLCFRTSVDLLPLGGFKFFCVEPKTSTVSDSANFPCRKCCER